ncbi:MAG: hypothetical protein IPP86_02335 [Bacteroidetes bacterium]|nr:hypothetical protein [Bacteroidota bacterium]
MKTQKIKLYVALTVSLFGTVGMVHAQKGEFGVRLMPTFSSFDLKSSGGNTISGMLLTALEPARFWDLISLSMLVSRQK